MIPVLGCDPNLNIVVIGAEIIKSIGSKKVNLSKLIATSAENLSVSVDHIILTLDWLFIISAIICEDDKVVINETTIA